MFDEAIDPILRRLPRSTGNDLLGFVIDCDAYLEEQDFFEDVVVRETPDKQSMVLASVRLAKSTPSIQAASGAIAAAWNEISYRDLSLTSCLWYREGIIFRFLTAVPDKGLLVTGTIAVSGEIFAQLSAACDRDFASLGGPLLPFGRPWPAA